MPVYSEYRGSPMTDPRSYLDASQIKGIIDATDNLVYRRVFYVLAKTGRRVSEIVRCLTPSDIDFTNNLVNFTILKKKKKTKSLLPISDEVAKVLKRQITENKIGENSYIFWMSRQRVDQIFKKSAERIGITHIGHSQRNKPHVHLLRHSFAIRGAENLTSPADLVKLQNLLGHSRIDTTMFYLKFNPKEERELLERMWK
jgi:integrase/recombinase XerD